MSDTSAGETAPAVPPDPIYQKSYSVPIALASVALVGAVALAIADEAWLRRPYKAIQHDWKEATLAYLDDVGVDRHEFEKRLRETEDFKALETKAREAKAATDDARLTKLNVFQQMSAKASALGEALRVHRSEISALTYDAEHAAHEAGDREAATSEAAKPHLEKIREVEARKETVTWRKPTTALGQPDEQGNRPDVTTYEDVTEEGQVGELIAQFLDLQNGKGKAQNEIGLAIAPRTEAEKARSQWLADNLRSFKAYLSSAPEQDRARVVERAAAVGLQRYVDDYATMVPPSVVKGMRDKLEGFATNPVTGGEIQQFQIHLANTANWVDRCEVCHLGARSPIAVDETALRASVEKAGWSRKRVEGAHLSLFTSHPRAAELFAQHDPDKVGCSICHNGNGIAITDVTLAHGQNHHWLWPLHAKENVEAGCIQCHQQDVHLPSGPRVTAARATFQEKGCWGCHPYQGHDAAFNDITKTEGRIKELARVRDENLRREAALFDLQVAYEVPEDGDERVREERGRVEKTLIAERQSRVSALTLERQQVETEIEMLQRRLAGLHDERERVGPNLKEVRISMRPEVLTPWIEDPSQVRPDTKMPTFRHFGDRDAATGLHEEAKDIAAFIWQSSLDPAKFPELDLRARTPRGGSAGRGRQLLEDRTLGCLGCHAVEREGKKVGNDFAANLTQVGEKKTYEWIFRWIKDPRHRLVPYSVKHGRDLTAAEAAKEDPATLVWQMPTRMPNFRLSDDDARDLAAYLATLKPERKTPWPDAPWLSDATRKDRGEALVRHHGCAGCHEIAGLETERGIGTDLTKEGSKPIDRLDYGHLQTEAVRGHEPLPDWTSADGVKVFAPAEGDEHGDEHGHGGWFRPRGYFMRKIAQPDLYDRGKHFPTRWLRARMPQFRVTAQELHDLTTFLLGSVDTRVPATSQYRPDEAGQAVREGWWVVKKYNCEGCHEIEPGQLPAIQKLPWRDEATLTNAERDRSFPPTLVGAGYRLRPDFLADFLRDPSLGGGRERPRSVRRHLDVRMPTYHFTEDEIAKLVRFFGAKAKQSAVFQPQPVAPLTDAERAAAQAIWDKANCIQCHVIGDATPTTTETKAPDMAYAARRLRPEWMRRWIPRPEELMNRKTSMTNNFVREKAGDARSRWLYENHASVPELRGMSADHVDLMIRYVLELGAQRR
jgi:hypothetical protein